MAHPAFFLTIAVAIVTGVEGSRHQDKLVFSWARPLCEMVDTIDKIQAIGISLQKRGTNAKDLERFVRELRALPRKAERFLHANFDLPVKNSSCIQKLLNFKPSIVNVLTINRYPYSRDSFISLEDQLHVRNKINFILFETFLHSSKGASAHLRHIMLPLRNVCSNITTRKPLGTQETSILSICKNVSSCNRTVIHLALNRGVGSTDWDAKTLWEDNILCKLPSWKTTMPLMAAFFLAQAHKLVCNENVSKQMYSC